MEVHVFPGGVTLEPQPIICRSDAMQRVARELQQLAWEDHSVLLHGESGVGMGFVSRHIHQTSRRRHHPLVEVNCATIPESAFADALFGTNTQGAYYSASRGTLLLRVFNEIPASLQRKLMGVSVGIPAGDAPRIVATHYGEPAPFRNEAGIREDVLQQFDIVRLPSLRERGPDLKELTEMFLLTAAKQEGCEAPPLTPAELERIEHYPWPGNVRELWLQVWLGVARWSEGKPFIVAPRLR